MQKIVFILGLVFICIGCSVFRIKEHSGFVSADKEKKENLTNSIESQNIGINSFYIEKAEIEISGENGIERFLTSIKFENPDKYLISLKSKAGIEGVRIYISKDTVLINDRINRIQYFGSPLFLSRKYGISVYFLPVIFGDVVLDKSFDSTDNECVEKTKVLDGRIKGMKINYLIDCSKRKSIEARLINSLDYDGIKLEYSRFLKTGDVLIPRIIKISDRIRKISMIIKIDKLLVPWNGIIEFIPGKNYEIMQLL